MAMSDCIKCWDTPCTCGYEYRNYSKQARIKQAAVVLGVDIEALEICVRPIVRDKHPMEDATESELDELTKKLMPKEHKKTCQCKHSDAWRCAKADNLPTLACACSCHKYITTKGVM